MSEPPVRLSVFDENYRLIADAAGRIEVSIDGVVQAGVLAYDCEAGYLEREVHDENGDCILTPERDEIQRIMLWGTVTVRWKPE